MELLIKKEQVASKLQLQTGYNKDVFENVFIREAQQLDLKPLLCESFYCELLEKKEKPIYKKLIEGGSYEYEDKKYCFEGLGTVISYFAYARFVFKSNIVSTSHGFVVKDTPYSDPAALQERKNLYHLHQKEANTYFEEVKI